DPPRAGNMRHRAVEHLAIALVGVETLVEESAQETSALRGAVGNRIAHAAHFAAIVLQPRREIAHRDKPETRYGRVRDAIGDLIRLPRLETAIERDRVPFDSPPAARDRLPLSQHRRSHPHRTVGTRAAES